MGNLPQEDDGASLDLEFIVEISIKISSITL
jgi:hypothetical protein